MTRENKQNWNIDLAKGFDVTMWKAMQTQRIGKKLLVRIVHEPPKAEEAEFFGSFTAWSYHEQEYKFYISNDQDETEILVYQEDMSSKNAGKFILIEAEQSISYLERKCCHEQIRNYCDKAVRFLFSNRVWK